MRLKETLDHEGKKPSLKAVIRSKLKVLSEFCIIDPEDKMEVYEYKQRMYDEVAKYPNRDYEIVLDQFTTGIIMAEL